ncbi:MAG: hypothetical protein ABL907_17070 [Hyphomicrobium sp.]
MNRRDFITSATFAAAAAGFAGAAGARVAAKDIPPSAPYVVPRRTRDLVLASPYAPSASGHADAAFALARRLERALDGRVRIHLETHAAGTIDALNAGTADLYFATGHADVHHAPALAYFAGLPWQLGMDAAAFDAWIYQRGGEAMWDESLSPFAIKPLLAGHDGATARPNGIHTGGSSGGIWSRAPLTQWTGLRIASEGLASEVLKALGAEPVRLAPSDIATALDKGAIDAADAGSLDLAASLGLMRVARHCIEPGVTAQGSSLILSIRRRLWDDFSGATQHVMRTTARETGRERWAATVRNGAALRGALRNAYNVQFTTIAPASAIAPQRVSEAIVADLASRSAFCGRLNGVYVAHAHAIAKTDCTSALRMNDV